MRYFLIFAFSLPVFAQDWGRYANGYIAPPRLAEIQAIQIPVIPRYAPQYVSPKGGKHPNATPVDTRKIFQTPPQIGDVSQRVK